jgi:hypothetical protein
MKKKFIGLILLSILFSACEKSLVKQTSLKGTIKGQIYTANETGRRTDDKEGIVIQLEGSNPLLSYVTDTSGKFEISNIPSGTYNLIISKEGYSELQFQGYQIVGGIKPLYIYSTIAEQSTTKIENISLEGVNSNEITLKGTIHHNFVYDEISYNTAQMRYYIHNTEDVTKDNYLYTMRNGVSGDSGSQFDITIHIDNDLFPSGSKIYVIAYGCSRSDPGYYDILSNLYNYTSTGIGSNIANIIVP